MIPQRLASCVIAHPDDPTEALKTVQDLFLHRGFASPPVLIPGLRPFRGKANNTVENADNAITAVHAKCIATMVRRGCTQRREHILVMEDDCRFHGGSSTYRQILRLLDTLERVTHGAWWSLHLGHVPLGPVLPITHPVSGDVLVWSSLPFTGHAYVINYRIAAKLCRQWRRRPFSHEGMMGAPFWMRFAVQPSMATQNRRPKELKQLDETIWITRLFDFQGWTDIVCVIALLLPLLLLWLIVHIVRRTLSK